MSLISCMVKWKKQMAVLLTITLTGNLGVIVPLADSKDNVKQMIEEVSELPEEVQKQKVKLGTKEAELELPESLKVKVEQEEKTELYQVRASGSDAEWDESDKDKTDKTENNTKELWKNVLVTWSLTEADNGLEVYDGNTSGVYTFEAELNDQRYDAEDGLLPVITVEVQKEALEEINDEEFFLGEMVELGEMEISSLIAAYGIEDGSVDLAQGNHEKWIDRIVVPDYAKEYYKLLEEGSDNDGNNDWLIEDKYFSKEETTSLGKLVFNGFPVTKISSDSKWSNDDNEWSYIKECIWVTYSAFFRDHPEVFWLANAGMLTYTEQRNAKGGYDYTIYYINKVHESKDGKLYDVRDEIYQEKNGIKNAINQRDQAVREIMDSVSSDDIVDQIIGYNDWLTHNNQYCSTYPDKIGELAHKSITALIGSIGSDGPICQGYAYAFKVLCDKAGIPCVLVDGFTYNKPDNGHIWNYVEIEGEWYAVDVTWNDPFDNSEINAVSGQESNYWTLLGQQTPVRGDGSGTVPFIESHPVNNNPGSFRFPNGPELSEERYPIIRPVVEFSETEQKEIYTGKAPEIKKAPTVKLEDGSAVQNPQISYSYAITENGKYTDGLPIDAGTYFIRAKVASSKVDGYRMANSSNTLKLTIEKAPRSIPAPTVKDKTDASVTLNPVTSFTGANDGTVEYAWNTVNHVPDSGWQKNSVITGLHRNRTYYFFSRITDGKNYQDAASASGTEEKTDKTKLPKPTLKQSVYTHTGGNITAEFNGFDTNTMNVTGHSAVESGNYQAEVTLKSEDFTWADGTSVPVVYDWKIMLGRSLTSLNADSAKITENKVVLNAVNAVPAESITDGVLEYGYAMENDSSLVKNWQAGTEFTGLESGTTYYFFARITGGTEYIDVTTQALSLTTKKIKLAKPVLTDNGSYVYNGSLIQLSVTGFRTEEMTIRANAFRNAGDYTAKISLNDIKHYEWEDGSSEPVSFNWKITKKPVTVKAANKSKYYGEENPALTLEEVGEGVLAGDDKVSDLKVTLTTTAEKNSAAGSYPITGKAAEDSNYEVTVESGTLTITRRSSGGGGGGGGGSRSSGGSTSGGPGSSLPSYVVEGEWSILNGFWHFTDASGNACINNWVAASYKVSDQKYYDWFRFDPFGNMLTGWFTDADGSRYYLNPLSDGTLGKMMTGWVWIADETGVQRCYYLNPNSDGYQGKMITNAVVDGYTIDANGWWTVDGVVQVK